MNCQCGGTCLQTVAGVGDWSGFWSGVGNFLGSDFGKALVNVGVTVGSAYALKELDLTGSASPGGSMTSSGYVNPAASNFNPLTQPGAQQPQVSAQSTVPQWALPVALGFGALLVVVLAMKK